MLAAVLYLSKSTCFVHARAMDQKWMKEYCVTSLHFQMNTRCIWIKIMDTIIHLVYTTLNLGAKRLFNAIYQQFDI